MGSITWKSRILGISTFRGGMAAFVLMALSACGGGEESRTVASATTGFDPSGCPTMTTSASWTPNVTGAGNSNHDSAVTVTRTTLTATGPITGMAQPAPASREISVSIDMSEDLGPNGSLSLIAKVTGLPSDMKGTAYPMLVYLSDGTNDYINLSRSGVSGDCASQGYFTCSGSSCVENAGCRISWPSAYVDRTHWQQRQITNQGFDILPGDVYPSVNTFPTCNWTGGSTSSNTQPACAFNSTFFEQSESPKRLKYGTTYTAKYVLLASDYSTVSGKDATLEVTVVKKANANASVGGAMDVNVVLVGSKNIEASRSSAGQRNLNSLFQTVQDQFSQSSTSVKLGAVSVYEWDCNSSGDAYASVSLGELPTLFQIGSAMIPSASTANAINLFFVTEIPYDSDNNLTVLGLAGGIGGPLLNQTAISGIAVSTFNQIASFNPKCTESPCPITQQESAFVDMGATITHEMGHYLGLNHPSEADGGDHDIVLDTPLCTAKDSSRSYITGNSCLNLDTNRDYSTNLTCSEACTSYSSATGVFCPSVSECQFNHVMWWTSKKFKEGMGTGDGNLFSTGSGRIINFHPLVH